MSVVDVELGRAREAHRDYVLSLADRAIVLAQQLCAWITHLPSFEEDLAISNIALDLLGQARALYTHAGLLEGGGRGEDELAFLRGPEEFLSPRLVEWENGDFAHLITRQLLHDSYAALLWERLRESRDRVLAEIAAKAVKETRYHVRYAREWAIRLGDGTDESNRRMRDALDQLWPSALALFGPAAAFTELVDAGIAIDPLTLRADWEAMVAQTLREASLPTPSAAAPDPAHERDPGRLTKLLEVMQAEFRAHPGANW